jgi:hypothetical protein
VVGTPAADYNRKLNRGKTSDGMSMELTSKSTEPALEMPPDVAVVRRSRKRTRQGKTRLLSLSSLDGRTAAAAAAKRLVSAISADLGNDLSAGERQLVQRIALVGAIVDNFETKWVAGQQIELGDYLQACRTQCRLLALLGLHRRARDISAPLQHDGTVEPWSPLRSAEARRIDADAVNAEIMP